MTLVTSTSPSVGTAATRFPSVRMRRLRTSTGLRDLVRENRLSVEDLIYPMFVRPGQDIRNPIASMPGQAQWSVDRLVGEVERLAGLGIRAVLLFGIPSLKDSCGSENWDSDGIVPTAIRAIKQAVPGMIVISDMCFCEYTDHGHCGVINTPDSDSYDATREPGYLLNDLSIDLLGRASVIHAQAGADIIAPSAMLDGMVGAIRLALDNAGFHSTAIMSYAAKFASGFYGPFREAAESPPQFGDRSQYQMDPGNRREALREVALDVDEGADMVMVKPALPYLDILREVRDTFDLPVAAYQVSGEFAMLHAAAANGWIDLQRCALESLIAIKRAGAGMVLTYFAPDVALWMS